MLHQNNILAFHWYYITSFLSIITLMLYSNMLCKIHDNNIEILGHKVMCSKRHSKMLFALLLQKILVGSFS